MDVEDAAAFGVRERAHAVLGRELRQRCRGRPAPAQDHERDEVRERDELPRPPPTGEPAGPAAPPRRPATLEAGTGNAAPNPRPRPEWAAARTEQRAVPTLPHRPRNA